MKTKKTTATGVSEMVESQGTDILRLTDRKDDRSKIYTAKGPRDRRLRLSAHTAIQFYDVQDRLGYDRPSKAVDWLITKAKSSIDKLAELQPSRTGCFSQVQSCSNEDNALSNLIPPLDLDSMKVFFPTSSTDTFIDFQTYQSDLISPAIDSSQDLGLSLQTFKNTGLVLSEHSSENKGKLFCCLSPAGFEASHRRKMDWNSDRITEHGGGFVFPSPTLPQPPSLGQGSPALEPLPSTVWNDFPTPDFGIQAEEDQGTISQMLSSSSSPISHR